MNKKKKVGVKKQNIFNKNIFILFIICLSIFFAVAALVVTNNIKCFDDGVYSVISKLTCEPITLFFKTITLLCNTETIIGVLLVLFVLMKDKKLAALIILNTVLCVILNQVVKHIFLRTRPVGIALINQGGYSFPSGHSMTALAFYGLFIYMVSKLKINNKYKIILSIVLGLIIFLIGLSRIYLGVHFASDVLGGFALALAYLIAFINLVYRKNYNS